MTRSHVVLMVLVALAGASGCKKAPAPNTGSAEDKLLYELGNTLAASDKKATLALFDLDIRQRLELWDKTLKPLNRPDKQLEAYNLSKARLGDAAALATTGDEAWLEVRQKPWIEDLAAGRCTSGPVAPEDVDRGVMPKEQKAFPQEISLFIFEMRTAIKWMPAFRVTCPSETTLWILMAQRKKTDAGEAPLKVVRVTK